jgi:hypothetical protein
MDPDTRHPDPRGGNTQVQLGETLLDMDPDTITDTQIHEVETLMYSWGRLSWTWTLTP